MSSSVISSPSPPSVNERNLRAESPRYKCTTLGCNQLFTNPNELATHKQKHQMTLKLGPSRTGLADMLPFDQTPTPTKFLQFGKETGLFDEITNPFDSEFKRNTSGQSLKERAKRSAVPGLIINNQLNKARTPTNYAPNQIGLAPIAQPVHVITLTPTLPSPVGAIAGGPFFLPPLPSPQAFLPSPAALISPSIVPFSAPGLPFHSMQAVAQQAAITQAFINAVASSGHSDLHQAEELNASSHGHMTASRTSSINDLPNSANVPFPTQTVSVPVHGNPTPPTCHAMPVGQNMPSAPVGSASVIQQHGQVNVDHQRRALSQSNSLDHQTHQMPNMERKPSFHGETSVITQAPANSSTSAQMNPNINMHNATSAAYQQYMGSQNNITYHQQPACEMSRVQSHPVLTSSRSVPIPAAHNGQHALPHQNSLPNIDAKQKLKETLTNNNPHLQVDMPLQFSIKEEDKNQNEVSSSSGNDGKPSRRRGRQGETDPDRKRMRFLERNRAAASRCRAKKKQWVSGLEVKAKELGQNNVGLQNEVASLREEVASLKQLLLAHRDCPITRVQQQKLANAGGDPSAVVTNPVQAAASLLGLTQNENGENHGDKLLPPSDDDIKPTLHLSLTHSNSNSSLNDDCQGHNMHMQTSVLVTPNIACKSELGDWVQATNASTIVMNDNYASSSSSLSSVSST